MDLSFLASVLKPTRYAGGEVNEVRKCDSPGLLHVALAFPDGYEIAMSTVGLKILYALLNAEDGVWAERVFMPMPDMIDAMAARDLPLFSLESKRPLNQFDVVGFTLQFELTYTNILHMLRMGKVPLRAAERGPGDPVVVAGGPCACNPEPLAPFLDAAFIGDGEEGFLELCEVVRAGKGQPRRELWRSLAAVPGTYVPGLYRTELDSQTGMEVVTGSGDKSAPFPVTRRVLGDLDRFPFPARVLVPHHEVVHDRYSVEIARGCAVGCRFCQAGYVYRPARPREPGAIQRAVSEGIEATGFDEVTLLSLNAGEYPGVEALVGRIVEEGRNRHVGVSMPSLRVSALTRDLAEALATGRKSSFTIAPEAGTQRMRDLINKKVTDEDMEAAAEAVFSAGWSLVKLYFMLGLPTEEEADVEAIARLAERTVKAGREAGCAHPRVTVSTSSFVPKPFTPFQWCAMAGRDQLEAKQSFMKKRLRRPVAYKWNDVRASVVEGVLSLGDRRLAPVLETASELGCRFDGWTEHFRWDLWQQAFSRCGVNPEDYLYRERGKKDRLPWDHIDVGVSKAYLWKEWEKALRGETTETCGPDACGGCGFFARECKGGVFEKTALSPAGAPARPRSPLPVSTYRLRYRKEGVARFLGHLDLVETLVRALRRVGVSLSYSGGYHPKPKVELPAPLPLGVEGREEWMEFKGHVGDLSATLADLAENLPAGLVPERLVRVSAGAPSLSELEVQVYRVGLEALDPDGRARIMETLDLFLRADAWPVTRRGKKKTRSYDLRERVLSVTPDENGLTVCLTRGGFMDFVRLLCPGPEGETLRLERIALEFQPD